MLIMLPGEHAFVSLILKRQTQARACNPTARVRNGESVRYIVDNLPQVAMVTPLDNKRRTKKKLW